MTKLVRIDEVTYVDLVHITGEMMTQLGKPWSLGMSVRMAVAILEEYMKGPSWQRLIKKMEKWDIPSPEEFLTRFEKMHKTITSDDVSAGP